MTVDKSELDARYELANEILSSAGLYFCHSYWIYGDVDASPGIVVGWKVDDDRKPYAIFVGSVVNWDVFSETITIYNESQLRAVLDSLILLVKNWHDNVQELREELNYKSPRSKLAKLHVVRDMILLVEDVDHIETLKTLNNNQLLEIEKWAAAEILHANDNPDVERLPRPKCLPYSLD